jgi:predicted phosphohydrolase
MARFELNNFDRIGIRHARKALADAEQLDMSDDRAMARAIGRLQAAVEDLLEILEGEQ